MSHLMQPNSHLICASIASGNCMGEVEVRPPKEGSRIRQWTERCEWHQREIEELQAEVDGLRARSGA